MITFLEFKSILTLGFSEDVECRTLARVLVGHDNYIRKGGYVLTLVLGTNEIRYDGTTFQLVSQTKPFVFTSRDIEKVYEQLTGE